MKRFFTYFFVVMGVIFCLLILFVSYLWFFDPLDIRSVFESPTEESVQVATTTADALGEGTNNEAEVAVDKHEYLTPAQEDALTLIGIDPSTLPDTVTGAQMECFVRVLGEERVGAIKAGATPTPLELIQARGCL